MLAEGQGGIQSLKRRERSGDEGTGSTENGSKDLVEGLGGIDNLGCSVCWFPFTAWSEFCLGFSSTLFVRCVSLLMFVAADRVRGAFGLLFFVFTDGVGSSLLSRLLLITSLSPGPIFDNRNLLFNCFFAITVLLELPSGAVLL